MATKLFVVAASAAALMFTAAGPASALDVGKTAKSVSRSVSKSLSGLSGGSKRSTNSYSNSASKNESKSRNGRSGTSLDLGVASVGLGSKNSGANVSVRSSLLGGTKADVNVLGRSGVANVNARTGLLGTKANVGVLNNRGVANATVSTGLLNTRANIGVLSNRQLVNLGVSIGGQGPGQNGPNGPNNPGPNGPGVIGGMSEGQIAALKVRCVDILGNQGRFDAQLVALCRILQQI